MFSNLIVFCFFKFGIIPFMGMDELAMRIPAGLSQAQTTARKELFDVLDTDKTGILSLLEVNSSFTF